MISSRIMIPSAFVCCLFLIYWNPAPAAGWFIPAATPRKHQLLLQATQPDTPTQVPSNRRKVFHRITTIPVSLITFPSIAKARNLPQTTDVDESKTGTIETLIPVVRMQQSLISLQSQLQSKTQANSVTLPNHNILPRDETSFKRIFDAYSDPVSYKQKFVDQNAFLVYYTKGFDGPGRPNIEDDLPVQQTLQYGARNDAWVAWDEFLVEWDFKEEEDNQRELEQALANTIQAIEAYLKLAPPADLQTAKNAVGDAI